MVSQRRLFFRLCDVVCFSGGRALQHLTDEVQVVLQRPVVGALLRAVGAARLAADEDARCDQEADRVYTLLSDAGEIFMKMEKTFFANRFAMLRDKFGTSWMILHERPRP